MIDTSLFSDVEEIVEGKSETHGPPEDSFGRIAAYWSTYLSIEKETDVEMDKADVAEMLALFKLARAQSGLYNEDDYRDRLAYVTFANEFRQSD